MTSRLSPILSTSRVVLPITNRFICTKVLVSKTLPSLTRYNSSSRVPPEMEPKDVPSTKGLRNDLLYGESAHFLHSPNSPFEKTVTELVRSEESPWEGRWVLHNPVYSTEELQAVKVVNRPRLTLSDKAAHGMVKMLRKVFDLVSMYTHQEMPTDGKERSIEELRKMGVCMSPDQWLTRCIVLETTAAIPGMVGGALRHLTSLRLMKRDGGWINTLLQEAENERMHLLTFMTLRRPSIWFRALILGMQGLFWNAFFITYVVSPKLAHRFVAALEEEAVYTYTNLVKEIDSGLLPEWENEKAPQIAIDYWRLDPEHATLRETILAIRADEANHRFVNHTLANMDHKTDFNPFSIDEAPASLRGLKAGFTREEANDFAKEVRERAVEGSRNHIGLIMGNKSHELEKASQL